MRAWLLDDYTGVAGLRLAEAPDPVPGNNEVVLHVRFAALNPADRYLAERQYPAKPTFPHILGRDGLGTVVAVGDGVRDLRPGEVRILQRSDVGVNRPGTFAERVAVAAESLLEVPLGWSEEESAGAVLVYLTAYQALTLWGPLGASSVVLVTGASGGVGVASVQLAAAMGCKVIGLSRNAEKRRRIEQLGAALTLDPAMPRWYRTLKDALGAARVELAIDNIGGTLLPEVIETLGDGGKVSIVGRLAGPVPQFNTSALLFRRNRLGGVAVGSYSPAEGRAAWREIVSLLGRNSARPQVDRIFPFNELPQAFERLAQGPMGKVLLRVG